MPQNAFKKDKFSGFLNSYSLARRHV